jgi:beta-galactosidase/beta-glucuronidase
MNKRISILNPGLSVIVFIGMLFINSKTLYAQEKETPINTDPIRTSWSGNVNPDQPLPEYPRPQLVRKDWQNLNGKWSYSITKGKLGTIPSSFDGEIIVPYPVESVLSGVAKSVGKDKTLWYKKKIKINKNINKERILLHFGAVDWKCELYINGKKVGEHEGGYDAFSFDITRFLAKSSTQEIVLGVWDPSDEGPQPNGKQVVKPRGIWYTSVTGIWQTVWLEGVSASYIVSTKHTADIDAGKMQVQTNIENTKRGDKVEVNILDGNQLLSKEVANIGETISLFVPKAKLWSPDAPKLYNLEIKLLRNGKVIDQISSYCAMRKITMGKDPQGVQRMLLNNKFVFQYGPLDQGWWPDGLYTAPTDEALLFDVMKTKEMGFNMIRKHIKVEPARWYHHCDQVGLLVWQDMPSGDLGGNHWDMRPGLTSGRNHDKIRTPESEAIYRKELKAMMDGLYNFPSIVVWVPFNEAWGQFKTVEITNWTMRYDPSRLVNSASGGNFFPVGHIFDIHNYPEALMPRADLFADKQILVLGEFGGLGLPIEGHTWQKKDNWGYQSFKTKEELKKRYAGLVKDLLRLIPQGLSAAVYTQTTDVEIEINGLITYDRKVVKIPEAELKEMHKDLYK